ncbi:MAG: zinc ribbon domain-containing protein [Pelovirga sp.]
MPMYEYQCEDCGFRFELRRKFSDSPVSDCTQCGGHARKLISRAGFALKGGGWYQQGYGAAPGGCSAPAAAGSEACAGCPKAANG